MQSKTKSFTNLLNYAPELASFVSKVQALEKINQDVISKLDPNLANHCRVANLRDGILILNTTSPVWRHKLRFASLDLLSALRTDPRWSGLKAIEIKVDYPPSSENTSTPKSKRALSLSATSAKFMQHIAETIASPSLAQALKKLAKKH